MPDTNDNDTGEEQSLTGSLRDRVQSVRNTVQRKETSIRAKRRAKAREERMADPGLTEELGNLKSDVAELASTAADSEGASSVGTIVSQAGEAFGEIDTAGLDEPMMADERTGDGFVDPVSATQADDPGDVGAAEDKLLDPAEADPLSLDDEDELF